MPAERVEPEEGLSTMPSEGVLTEDRAAAGVITASPAMASFPMPVRQTEETSLRERVTFTRAQTFLKVRVPTTGSRRNQGGRIRPICNGILQSRHFHAEIALAAGDDRRIRIDRRKAGCSLCDIAANRGGGGPAGDDGKAPDDGRIEIVTHGNRIAGLPQYCAAAQGRPGRSVLIDGKSTQFTTLGNGSCNRLFLQLLLGAGKQGQKRQCQ